MCIAMMNYDCIIIGGGIAGLQAAIQLGRYQHKVLVVDAGGGRSSLCKDYHNLLGWPDGVSGEFFRTTGKKQAQSYGVVFKETKVNSVQKSDEGFIVTAEGTNEVFKGKRLLFATGITENLPDLPGLIPCLGKSIYLCPDCDGYEIKDKRTIVIGSSQHAVQLALILTYWSKDIIVVNHDKKTISTELKQRLEQKSIPLFEEEVKTLHTKSESEFTGVTLESSITLEANHAFLAMGGAHVNSDLAKSIGVERLENKHIVVDARTKQTSVPHVWAVGDVVAHSQLLTIAMGDGAQAAIWIHKSLLH